MSCERTMASRNSYRLRGPKTLAKSTLRRPKSRNIALTAASSRKLARSKCAKRLLSGGAIRRSSMQQYTIPERHRFAILERDWALLCRFGIREIALANGICCKQSVRAHVPARQRAKTLGMTHD